MQFIAVLLLAAVAYGARYEKATTRIPGSYLIKVKDGASLDGMVVTFEGQFREGRVNHKWDNLNILAVNLPDALAGKLLALDAIEYVEEDGVFYTQAVGSWGIDRIDQRIRPLDNTYTPPRSGSGQTVHVIDTGIHHSHNDYGMPSRASYHWDYQPDNKGEDCNGHGTHCAGTVGGATYGVAPGVALKSVRVLSCFGSGSTTNVVNGVNSVISGVGSMSLGGGSSSSIDTAVANAVDRGVVMSVAAGNDNSNACNYSPAREPKAITVGATDSGDTRSSFSNYGNCVDIFAPGSSITSTWHTSDSATNTISGTSMACPHVSGGAALLLARGVTADKVHDTIVAEATPDEVGNPGRNSPNTLLCVKDLCLLCDLWAMPELKLLMSDQDLTEENVERTLGTLCDYAAIDDVRDCEVLVAGYHVQITNLLVNIRVPYEEVCWDISVCHLLPTAVKNLMSRNSQ